MESGACHMCQAAQLELSEAFHWKQLGSGAQTFNVVFEPSCCYCTSEPSYLFN